MVTKKSSPAIASEDPWRAEEDLRTLARAREIEADRKRLSAAQKIGAVKIKEMQSVLTKKPVPMKPATTMRKR